MQETNELVAAAPLTAQQQMIQTWDKLAQRARLNRSAVAWKRLKRSIRSATPEQLEHMNNTYLDTVLGTREKSTMKPLTSAKPYKGTDGRYYLSMQDPLTGAITAEPMPEGYQPPPEKPGTSKFAMNPTHKQLQSNAQHFTWPEVDTARTEFCGTTDCAFERRTVDKHYQYAQAEFPRFLGSDSGKQSPHSGVWLHFV